MRTKLFTLAQPETFNNAKADIIGTISNHIEKLFKISIAVEIFKTDNGDVKLKFTYPFEDTQMCTEIITLPKSISTGLMEESNETKN